MDKCVGLWLNQRGATVVSQNHPSTLHSLLNHCSRQGSVIHLFPLCWQTQQCQACKRYFLSATLGGVKKILFSACFPFFFVHRDVRRREETQPEREKKNPHDMKNKKKRKPVEDRGTKIQTNYRFAANTWGPEHVWGSDSFSDNNKT